MQHNLYVGQVIILEAQLSEVLLCTFGAGALHPWQQVIYFWMSFSSNAGGGAHIKCRRSKGHDFAIYKTIPPLKLFHEGSVLGL